MPLGDAVGALVDDSPSEDDTVGLPTDGTAVDAGAGAASL